ncbi:AAA family ATPase [Paenibacillus senegalensis]|uniref:AAA family ATPase n=1 Tax=Paenibacillus senegalensis TaxID=1465766 RepID=UPI00028959B2|nr:AAA family ATPase [Paenibacillus senegalensis]
MQPIRGITLITGIMAAGKSTIAQRLAERLQPKSIHLRGDAFRRMIVSGREEMLPNPSEEAIKQLQLRYKTAAMVADQYYEAGFHVVMQDVILGADLQTMVGLIQSRPLYVIVLSPSVAAVAEREQVRAKKGYGAWEIADLNHLLQTETPRLGLWLDTTNMTPDDTVNELLARMHPEASVRM